jgi:iron(II)-dependent oxidoreductase
MDSNRTAVRLTDELREARRRTLELVADLDDEQMIGPRLVIVNPLRWEIGHVAWFQEYWLLRHLGGRSAILSDGDSLYDSAKVAHDTRWKLPLPSKTDTIAYMTRILDEVAENFPEGALNTALDPSGKGAEYFLSLALFHEDMHDEAITYTRQTLELPVPELSIPQASTAIKREEAQVVSGDALVPGGSFVFGNATGHGFVFDNEQQPCEVEVPSFAMSRTATTNEEFATFVTDQGYQRRECWSDEGWRWRESVGANHPVYWKFAGGEWWRRNFAELVPLESKLPVLHVNWYEADAYCRWAGRRLPTEVEWEMAASAVPGDHGIASDRKQRYPWGDDYPTPERANLDSRNLGCLDVRALPGSDSAFGCRQMIGNVWEWTASDFMPFPGFIPGPYQEYSAPWFGNHKVLRGGCWATRSRLISNTYRNFYLPDRGDVWAGFRTCAL